MASKRPQKKAIVKKTKTAKKKKQFQQFLKIPIGLAILLALVILAGFLTHHLLSNRYPVQMIGGTFEKSQHSMPAFQFEIYPEKDIPLTKEKKPQKTCLLYTSDAADDYFWV